MSDPNKWPKFAWAGFSCLVAFCFTVKAQDTQPGKLSLEPLPFRTFDGKAHDAELGRLWVRENRVSTAKQPVVGNAIERRKEYAKSVSAIDPHAKSHAKIRSKIPALFVSGTLDGTTPASQAEELRRGFPQSPHLLIENGGHETLPSEEVQAIVIEFFRGQDVSKRNVKFAQPKFSPLETQR